LTLSFPSLMLLSRDHGLATGLLFPKTTELLHTDFGASAAVASEFSSEIVTGLSIKQDLRGRTWALFRSRFVGFGGFVPALLAFGFLVLSGHEDNVVVLGALHFDVVIFSGEEDTVEHIGASHFARTSSSYCLLLFST
jgi:hypothetical protein